VAQGAVALATGALAILEPKRVPVLALVVVVVGGGAATDPVARGAVAPSVEEALTAGELSRVPQAPSVTSTGGAPTVTAGGAARGGAALAVTGVDVRGSGSMASPKSTTRDDTDASDTTYGASTSPRTSWAEADISRDTEADTSILIFVGGTGCCTVVRPTT